MEIRTVRLAAGGGVLGGSLMVTCFTVGLLMGKDAAGGLTSVSSHQTAVLDELAILFVFIV